MLAGWSGLESEDHYSKQNRGNKPGVTSKQVLRMETTTMHLLEASMGFRPSLEEDTGVTPADRIHCRSGPQPWLHLKPSKWALDNAPWWCGATWPRMLTRLSRPATNA